MISLVIQSSSFKSKEFSITIGSTYENWEFSKYIAHQIIFQEKHL